MTPSMLKYQKKQIINDLKHILLSSKKLSYNVEKSPEDDSRELKTTEIKLPDDQTIKFNDDELNEYYKYFFSSKAKFQESVELPLNVINTIQNCDQDIRKNLYSKIFLVGGNSLIRNFKEKFENQIMGIQTLNTKLKVYQSQKDYEVLMSSWIGGSILGSTAGFQNMWISKFEYEEVGENIVLRKCVN